MNILNVMKDVVNNKGWFSRLIDMNDETVSASTIFLIATSIVALLLLIIPMGGLLIDIIYNHTITINMSDMASYIASAATIFTAGGVLKGWTNYSKYRFNSNDAVNAENVEPTDDADEN